MRFDANLKAPLHPSYSRSGTVPEAIKKIPSLRVLQFHAGLVRLQKLSDLIGLVEQPDPLLVIEGDREASQAIHAHTALFADFKLETASLTPLSLFQFRDSGFQFFVTRFGHIDFLSK